MDLSNGLSADKVIEAADPRGYLTPIMEDFILGEEKDFTKKKV